MLRAEEEIVRIKNEMLNCVHHYIDAHKCLVRQAEFYKHSGDDQIGKISLLRKASVKCLNQLKSLQCFAKYTDINELQTFLTRLSNDCAASEQGLCDTYTYTFNNLCSHVHNYTYEVPVKLCMCGYSAIALICSCFA